MPLDTIYLTRHGHRLNWTIDYKTGTYHAQFPTPTGNPADPTLTSHGVRQSHELAAHLASDDFHPKPFRVYCSPFYRCLQTIQPSVDALKELHQRTYSDDSSTSKNNDKQIERHADFAVRVEPGLGEWFGHTTFFTHPPPATPPTLSTYFPTLNLTLPNNPDDASAPSNKTYKPYKPHLTPSPTGETIANLHTRIATTLAALIADVDAEIAALEAAQPAHEPRSSKAILICSHAAPLIAMGRALTGLMPEDSSQEDFFVFTAGLSTFRRRRWRQQRGNGQDGAGCGVDSVGRDLRRGSSGAGVSGGEDKQEWVLAPGTTILRAGITVQTDWRGGKGVAGGWDCVRNGDCGFLSQGAERGWHFNGEEGFDTGPMAAESAPPVSGLDTVVSEGVGERGMKL
ncbi:phosphoglycerate mutase family protein [Aspergillus homomorphus CBS 101889]|uniref:Phosphoglycerate mutase-like protein n=1 Tax=Aspergillus homomorphus (strain CBS 101889) TaxID=1450537 RepID=A0A395IAM3_ASPHC|nr:phosphoglycerate mutase-like protein [Aspergillus homomorphus CBS 101889]RAL16859.1 phosphoglycerate mutase-like protein [Aspergillus homomorphus CBS 101889]